MRPKSKIEEARLSQITARSRQDLCADRIAKKFDARLKQERETFLKSIKGIQAQSDRERYTSRVLNSLMFVYFIQKKGFLDGDGNYLRHRLELVQSRRGRGKFLSFYRHL